jgi:FtsH-binding integral membrane protein
MQPLQNAQPRAAAAAASAVDEGLRRYMLAIYAKVALGLGLAGLLAAITSGVPAIRDLLFQPAAQGSGAHAQPTLLGVLVAFAPLAVLLGSARSLRTPTARNPALVYWSLVVLFGASMGVLALNFTGLSIASTFALSALAFGALSLAGYVTRQNLSGLGAFLWTGVIGLLGALVLNLVVQSPGIEFAANAVGVLVFAGLIAYDTQRLKIAYAEFADDPAGRAAASNCGALSLFINFLNLFQFLLMAVSGERR